VDTDGDGVGDACDVETCGNGVVEGTRTATAVAAPVPVLPDDCTCLCTNEVADPKAKVDSEDEERVREAHRQDGDPARPYYGRPVVVRLDDGDSAADRACGASDAAAVSARRDQVAFKSKADGLQQVQLKSLEAKQPGMSQIVVKAKRWFSAAAANDPTPANTRLTITSARPSATRTPRRSEGTTTDMRPARRQSWADRPPVRGESGCHARRNRCAGVPARHAVDGGAGNALPEHFVDVEHPAAGGAAGSPPVRSRST
jgi:hypothetical protein